MEAPFKLWEIVDSSEEVYSTSGTTGKSNSIQKSSSASVMFKCDKTETLGSETLLAVKTPDSVMNSITFAFTKPDEKMKWDAAKVAWPQSSTCKQTSFMVIWR